MPKMIPYAALAALCLVPSALYAQDVGDAGPSGRFELEYSHSDGSGRTLLDGGIDIMHRGLAAGSVTLGFDLGVDATLDLSDGADDYAFFGAVVVDPGFGNIAVGAPRSIAGLLIDRPAFADSRALDRTARGFMPALSDDIARRDKAQSLGVRFDSEAGALHYGASLQKLDGISGMYLQAGAEYSFGQGAVEGVLQKNTDADGLGLVVGVAGIAQQIDYAFYMGHEDAAVDSTGLQAAFGYSLPGSLRIGGDVALENSNGRETTLYGATAQYDFSSGAYAQIGISDGNASRVTWDASIGFEF